MTSQMTTAPQDRTEDLRVAQEWLTAFTRAIGGDGDWRTLLHPEVWWRDLLALTGDFRSLTLETGIDRIVDSARALHFRDAEADRHRHPGNFFDVTGRQDVEFLFTFTTDLGRGRGVIRLVPGADGWRARSVLTVLDSLDGIEPAIGPARKRNDKSALTDQTFGSHRARAHDLRDRDPDVVIVGAGHSGLALAAWLGALGVEVLIIDTQERVGDNWRNRYDSLVLHDAVWSNHLPFMPFPETWPVFTPKDKVGDWLESYARALDLNVWCGTEVTGTDYDPQTKTWSITVDRQGTARTLAAAHLVVATGISGTEPQMPHIDGAAEFTGRLMHSSAYDSDPGHRGRRAVVVGAGSSGHDIAQDLHRCGAEVTLIQRGPTHVVRCTTISANGEKRFNDAVPTEVSDLLFAAPARQDPAYRAGLRAAVADMARRDADLLDGLRARGFRLSDGVDGCGVMMLFLTSGGGYYIDVGASELIASGEIAVRSGVSVTGLGPSSVHLDDGTEIDADVVVMATGYRGIEATLRAIVGEQIAAQCHRVWDLDDEGELHSVWRSSGHERLWIQGGNFMMVRFYSKLLALQIAAELADIALPSLANP